MDAAVLTEIDGLRRATVAALQKRYKEIFGEEPRSRHREHLFRRIAWRLQALADGDLSDRARSRAREIAHDADLRMIAPKGFFEVGGERVVTARRGGGRDRDNRLPLPGSLLTRKWKGRTIVVEVLGQGFRCETRHYSSLSRLAAEITGTRWNGLAFFGLTRARVGKENPRAAK
jgi:hypothetical protein